MSIDPIHSNPAAAFHARLRGYRHAGHSVEPERFYPEPAPGVMTLHVFGVPHTITRKRDFQTCAFTQKVWKLCAMMHRRGHRVIHYGVEGSEVECTEHVSIMSLDEWSKVYSIAGTGFYDTDMSKPANAAYIAKYTERLRAAIEARTAGRKKMSEILAITWGGPQIDATIGIEQFKVETGIGYRHTKTDLRVYESYAWLHMQLGELGDVGYAGNKFYWSVIPNAFDLSEFEPKPDDSRKEYLLYMGRLNRDKGIPIAVDLVKRTGRKLLLVGPGDPAPWMTDGVVYMPPVEGEARRKLMAEAYAVLCPTLYVEPFCGVNVEAQLCGTPVITTDWGVFPETVVHGMTGFRCRTMEQFEWAVNAGSKKLDRHAIRAWAKANYSMERVSLQYEEYLQSVLNLHYRQGFYLDNPNRKNLDWLVKQVPYQEEPESADDFRLTPEIDRFARHIPPPAPPVESPQTEWQIAQAWEHDWWGLEWSPKWDDEIRKQEGYFRLVGFPDSKDFSGKSVLDIGAGPVSILQRCKHGQPARAVDPLPVNEATRKRYADAQIEFLNIKAEWMPAPFYGPSPVVDGHRLSAMSFDEIWMYNCLQHVEDPHEILRRMIACAHPGTNIRIFEWIDLPICPGHIQVLTEEMFYQYFGGDGFERPIWNVGFLRGFGGTVTDKYIAIHAVKK